MTKGNAIALAAVAALGLSLPAVAQKSPVSVTGKNNAKGMTRLIIGQFTVGYVTDRTDSAVAKGFNVAGIGGGTARLHQVLGGVSAAEMQQITDAAHDDFVAKLRAAGYEVADRAPLLAHPDFAKIKPTVSPYAGGFNREKGNSAKVSYVGATATMPYHVTSESGGGGIAAGFKGIGEMMAYGTGVSTFVRDNKAYVVDVVYALDFADAAKSGGFGANFANVKAKAALMVVPEQTRVTVHAPSMQVAALTLSKPITEPADFFTQTDVTTAGSKRGQVIGNMLAGLTGGGSSSSRDISFTAAPGQFVPAATGMVKATNDAMVAQLVALR